MTGQRPRSVTARPSPESRQGWAIVLVALLAPATGVALTGVGPVDGVWAGLIAGVVAYLSSTSRRGVLLAAGFAAVATAASPGGLVAAAAAVAFAAMSTRHLRRRAYFARGLAGGLTAVSVMASSLHHPAPITAVAVVVLAGPLASGWRHTSQRARRTLRVAGIALGVFAVLAAGAAGYGVLAGKARLDSGTRELRLGFQAARLGDAETAAQHLARAELRITSAGRRIDRWGTMARLVPLAAQQVDSTAAVLGDVGRAAGQAGRTAVAADPDVLTVRSGRIDVAAIDALHNPLRRLARALGDVVDEVDRRADDPLVPPLARRLDDLAALASRAERDASLAAEAADVMPEMLGGSGTKRYLVLFTSPAEARGRLGFPGSFAEVLFTHGRFRLGEHGSTSTVFRGLQPDQGGFDAGDDLLRPYLPFGPTREMLSVTIPPDFPTVAAATAELWRQSGRPALDGVLRFDPRSLAALMRFTGPVKVPDVAQPLRPQTLEQFLLVDQYLQFPDDQAPRRELLDTVAETTFERLETAELPPPRQLADLFGPLVRTGHLQMAAPDSAASDFLEHVGMRGALGPPTSDALLVTNVNSSGNKIDTFLDRRVRYEAVVHDQELEGTVTVELHNGAPSADLPFYVIGSFAEPPIPPGTNRTTLLVYTAAPATSITVGGLPVTIQGQLTGGRWLHQVQIDLPPASTQTVVLTIRGPLPAGDYHLDLEPGGGVRPDGYEVAVAVGEDIVRFAGPVEERRHLVP